MRSRASIASRFLLLLCLGVLPGACADDGSGNEGGAEGSGDGDGDFDPPDAEAFPSALADSVCSGLFDCECTPADWPDEETCLAEISAELEAGKQWADETGLSYDENCAGLLVAHIQGIECLGSKLGGVLSCEEDCAIYYGEVQADEACVEMLFFEELYSDCDQGLECNGQGFCEQACVARPELGDPCSVTSCVEGAHCFNNVCVEDLALGEDCSQSINGCVAGAHCGTDTYICTEDFADGDECSAGAQCASGTCDFPGTNLCVPSPPWVCNAYGF